MDNNQIEKKLVIFIKIFVQINYEQFKKLVYKTYQKVKLEKYSI